MKKIYILFSILFFIKISVFCQTYPYTSEIFTGGKSFFISCTPKNVKSIEVSIKDEKDQEISKYLVYNPDLDLFTVKFVEKFGAVCFLQDPVKQSEIKNWEAFAKELFKNYNPSLQNKSLVAGLLSVSPDPKLMMIYINECNKNKIDTATAVDKYKLIRLDAEIAEGYLESIVAHIRMEDGEHEFILGYPVGISSEDNVKKFSRYQLYDKNSDPYEKPKIKKPIYFLNLSNVLSYQPWLEANRRDYSPKDTAINNMPGGTSILLHKEETSKLFEAHFYTDFKGFDEQKPNGLIQVELAKRINANTLQRRAPYWLSWMFKSYGFFQYISPVTTLSKIEQHNRKLNLNDLDSVRFNPGYTNINQFGNQYHRYANALSLYQYQWLSVGTDLNFFFINNPARKFHIYLNAGARFGFTDTTDSLTTISGTTITKTKFTKDISVSALQVYPEIKIKFLPDERFNLSISNKWVYFKPLNQLIQLTGYDKDNVSILKPKSHTWLNVSEVLMAIQVSPKSKVFGRFRMNWEIGNIKNNFSQIQVGYSTYILGKSN